MKKSLLVFMASLFACTMMANTVGTYYLPHTYFDKMSPNGKWLATQNIGSVVIYDRETDNFYEFYPSEDAVTEYYATGNGNCWSNTGILVGGSNDTRCGYWENGEWKDLPLQAINKSLNLANAITPDGNRIAGVVGTSGMNLNSSLMLKPVYWDRNEEGGYDAYVELPHPEVDFCGRVPQYVTALNISEDGKTILGQVRDWSGWYVYPIIYTQGSDNKWSYRTICEGVLYPEGTKFGEWPGDEPTEPDPTLYMTDENKAIYLELLAEYNYQMQRYENGEIGWEDVPEMPDPKDYMTDLLTAYVKALNEYQIALEEYYEKAYEFDYNVHSTLNGKTFIMNSSSLSGNGKYIASTIQYADEEDSSFTVKYPVRINIENGKSEIVLVKAEDMQSSTAMNDGRILAMNPAMAYARNSYMVWPDTQEVVPFIEYVKSVDNGMYEWVKAFSTFDVPVYAGADENGYPEYDVVEDSLVAGSVHCNSDGTIFTSFMFDEWTTPSGHDFVQQYSYQLDFTQLAGVEKVEERENLVYVKENVLYVQGEVESATIYDLRGNVMMQIENPTTQHLDIAAGIYLVRVVDAQATTTTKVIVR